MSDVRLIDANALLKEFEKRQEQQVNEYCDCFLNDAQELSTEWWCVEDAVIAAPTIDAVQVVRCRECKYAEKTVWSSGEMYCRVWKMNPRPDGFCHLGVKMDAKDMDVPTKDGGEAD